MVPECCQTGECTRKATCCRVFPHMVQSKAVLTLGWGGTNNNTITKQLLLYESTGLSELKHFVLSSSETQFSRVSVISRAILDLFIRLCYKHGSETPSVRIGLKTISQTRKKNVKAFFSALRSLTRSKVFFYNRLLPLYLDVSCQEKCLAHVCLGI